MKMDSRTGRRSSHFQTRVLTASICLILALTVPWFANLNFSSIWLPFRGVIKLALSPSCSATKDHLVFLPSRKCRPINLDSSTKDDTDVEELSQFMNALTRVVSLLPDDDRWEELLRPIQSSGNQSLRDIGMSTRAYKTYFEAWENLHMVRCGDDLYLRDDVVQTLHGSKISREDHVRLTRSYEAYRYFISHLSELLFPWTLPYFSDHMTLHLQYHKGQGIVFTAGDFYVPHLITSIRTLRHLGCALPIEVMYFGDEDLCEKSREELERLADVITRDMSFMIRNSNFELGGWDLKPFALLLSSFREAILIDADAYFLRNPACLFLESSYLRTGALFFIDRFVTPKRDRRVWLQELLPKPISTLMKSNRLWTGESGHMQESGVVVVDKWRHLMALLLVCRLNGPERGFDGVTTGMYDIVHGDKETFWIGWELVGDVDYAFHEGGIAGMGHMEQSGEQTETYTLCAKQLLHLDRSNRPFWFNGGLYAFEGGSIAHKDSSPLQFDAYVVEPKNPRRPAAWRQHENKMYWCLTSDSPFNFSKDDERTLEFIRDAADELGMFHYTERLSMASTTDTMLSVE